MKFSIKLAEPKPLDREQARACLVANLCFPGSGSLLAGRRVGYSQAIACSVAFCLSVGAGVPLIVLWIRQKSFPYFPDDWIPIDWMERGIQIPTSFLTLLIIVVTGIGLFVISWFWALLTSLIISSEVKRSAAASSEKPKSNQKPPALKAS